MNNIRNVFATLLTASLCTALIASDGRSEPISKVNDLQASPLNLSREERDYLQHKKFIRMCIDPDWMPYEQINEQGRHEGMSADYMTIFEQRIGIPIQLIPTSSWAESTDFAKARKCDILSLLNESPERLKYLNFTEPYIESLSVLVTRDDVTYLNGLKSIGTRSLSTPKGYIFEERVRKDYPKINLIPVTSVRDGLIKVSNGEVFAHLGSIFVVVNEMKKDQLSNLKVSGHTEYEMKLRIGVRNDDLPLVSIFDKAVKSLTEENHINIRRKWTSTKIELGTDYSLLWKFILGAMVLLTAVLLWNRKLAHLNAKIKESEAEYRAIFEASQVGLAMCKIDGTLVECNQAYLDIIGYTEEEALKLTYWDVTPKSFKPDEEKQMRSLEETGRYGPYEKYYIRKNGEKIPVLLNGTLLKGADGNDYIWSIIQDITDQKYIEKQLQLALETAETANKSKSDFLSSMSHELRTPLNAILGFAQVLELSPDVPLSKKQKNATHHILKGGEHLLDLINDVLNLAKIETGRIELMVEPVETQSVINECIPMVKSLSHELGVTIDAGDFSGKVIQADRIRFKQVLLNLMSNAIKYNRKNGSVSVTCATTDDDMLRIFIADTGAGIPADKQTELFVPFSRLGAENSTIEGTGIGLTITQRLLDAMGGKVGFESTEGVGSTFWVELPLAKNRQSAMSGPEREASENKFSNGGAGVVLYIEDNPANVTLMETIFDDVPGVRLETAHTAELGLATALQVKPDIILMDINLPGMNGIQALAELRRSKETRDIPVIAISADATPQDVDYGKKAGFLDYLTKPFNVTELIHKVLDVLDKQTKG